MMIRCMIVLISIIYGPDCIRFVSFYTLLHRFRELPFIS